MYGFYNITVVLEDEQEKRLEKLEEQFRQINGWNKQEIIQFGIGALCVSNIETMLTFMESKANQLEQKV